MESNSPYPDGNIRIIEQGKLDDSWSYEILRTIETAPQSRWSETGEELFGYALSYFGPENSKPEQTYHYKLRFPNYKQAKSALTREYRRAAKR